jgi:hypothetical protein
MEVPIISIISLMAINSAFISPASVTFNGPSLNIMFPSVTNTLSITVIMIIIIIALTLLKTNFSGMFDKHISIAKKARAIA